MRKNIYVLILPILVVSGIVIANREIKNEIKPAKKAISIAERKSDIEQRRIWEHTPEGIKYKIWENSRNGKKVRASYQKIKNHIKAFSDMNAIVTSVTFVRDRSNAYGPKWLIVNIYGEEYMMQFAPKDFLKLKSLKVNDKIIVRSRYAGNSPNHPYLIISCDYISKDNKVLFKQDLSKNNGC